MTPAAPGIGSYAYVLSPETQAKVPMPEGGER